MSSKIKKTIIGIILCVSVIGLISFFVNDRNSKNTFNSIESTNLKSEEVQNSPHADWVKIHHSSSELINNSDIIIKGRVKSSFTELRHDVVFTMNTIEVSHIYAIKSNNDLVTNTIDPLNPTLVLQQTGGQNGSIITRPFDEELVLTMNQEYVLFLYRAEEGYYLPSGGYQGLTKVYGNSIHFKNSETATYFPELEAISTDSLLKSIQSLPNISSAFIINEEKSNVKQFLSIAQ